MSIRIKFYELAASRKTLQEHGIFTYTHYDMVHDVFDASYKLLFFDDETATMAKLIIGT